MRKLVANFKGLNASRNRRFCDFTTREDGSLVIFSLFVFLMIIAISGMAVDLMRYENDRVGAQNTLDTAVIAAASLSQNTSTREEVEALVQDYFAKAGYDPNIVTVVPEIETPEGGTQPTLRSVRARVDFSMNTAFMNLLGVDELPGAVGGAAAEGQQLLEIVLVLDISGSMTEGSKLENVRTAAKDFVSTMIRNNGSERVLFSIVPYNHQVYMSPDLMNRLNIRDTLAIVDPEPTQDGAIRQYMSMNDETRCARFFDADFNTPRLTDGPELEPSSVFWPYNFEPHVQFEQPPANRAWCAAHYSPVLLYQSDETILHQHIDSLEGWGATSIDYGMNWAVGILEPGFRPVIDGMLADTRATPSLNLVPENASGHPVDFGTADVEKYIILMTDGANTQHLELKPEFQSGPSPVWYSQERADAADDYWAGFIVERGVGPASRRYYLPGNPSNTTNPFSFNLGNPFSNNEDQDMAESDLPADAEQWTYHRLYNRFTVSDAATYFFEGSGDQPAFNRHNDAFEDIGGFDTADANLVSVCNQAKENDRITVFTIAFEAPENGRTALQNCAIDPVTGQYTGKYFEANGSQVNQIYQLIASEISKLRLTQ